MKTQGDKQQSTEARLAAAEQQANAGSGWREKCKTLEQQFSRQKSESTKWQQHATEQQDGRQLAEQNLEEYRKRAFQSESEIKRLKKKLVEQPEINAKSVFEKVIQPMQAELEKLRPLLCWEGHPCQECGKPITGVISREFAAKVLRRVGYRHKRCPGE